MDFRWHRTQLVSSGKDGETVDGSEIRLGLTTGWMGFIKPYKMMGFLHHHLSSSLVGTSLIFWPSTEGFWGR